MQKTLNAALDVLREHREELSPLRVILVQTVLQRKGWIRKRLAPHDDGYVLLTLLVKGRCKDCQVSPCR